MKRRYFLAATAIAGTAAVLANKPRDEGAPHDDYFKQLNDQLRLYGDGRPRMLLDLDVIDRNIEQLLRLKNPATRYRLVEKSLPCPELIAYILDRTASTSLMSFHLPFLQQDTRRFANADILLGKPLPQSSVARFYQDGVYSGFTPAQQLCWLVDTQSRLQQYLAVAQAHRVRLRCCVEIDVGLHRGGLSAPQQLVKLMELVQKHPDNLEFAGFMGYDAHVGKIPAMIESRDESFKKAVKVYEGFVQFVREHYPGALNERSVLNGAGSPTFALHRDLSACNDLSAGSCLVKPSDFDVETLHTFSPAAFIATPVLKSLEHTQIPGLEAFAELGARWNPNLNRAYFIYGGRWLATPHSPKGLADNPIYGVSSNQQLINGSAATALNVDDYVFLRPSQSESVFLQFGDVWTLRQGKLHARWSVLNEET